MPRKKKILLVDDEVQLISAIAERLHLTTKDIEIKQAYNADCALRMLEDEQPDIAIVDIMMPGTDGIELTKMIKQLYPSLQVVILTGYKNVYTEKKALEAGASAVFDKWCNKFASLADKVRHILENYGSAVAFAERNIPDEALREVEEE